ncbi:hypothetical protein D5S17_22450 [Pseudonocardiaceae bacterium YIM PH 21723]|nr:hypothetical protein D5S17_22450 [Pseudonocardiaceae bacterium YIM PH 21723]
MVLLLIVVVVIGIIVLISKNKGASKASEQQLADAQSEARRWVERLGGQVLNLVGSNDAAKQALADASERYTAAGSQLDQARSAVQCQQATQTAMEGLYYVRAARTAMDLDPGPELPDMNGQKSAGSVTEDRQVSVEGHNYAASPNPGAGTRHYYPGGMVAGRPVPQGWYSEPWWKPALVAGAWGVGSYLLMDAMFSGMHGVGGGFGDGYAAGMHDQALADSGGGDSWDGGSGDGGGWDMGDMDFGSSDW